MAGLEKLKKAAELIEGMTHWDQRFKDGGVGHPFIYSAENAHLGLEMIVRGNPETQKYDVTFGAYARDVGKHMNSDGVYAIAKEAARLYALMAALELELAPFSLTKEEFWQFDDWIAVREAQEQSETQTLPDGPVMRM
jgi:hypothetical protein